MNIVLIGMRGSGKSTVGELLTNHLSMQLCDMDTILEKRAGMRVNEIVAKHGWDYFREKESALVLEIAQKNNQIISTGGGVVMNPKNIKALKKHGFFVYLRTSVVVLQKRLKTDNTRAPLTKKKTLAAEIREILKQRKEVYESAANEIIDTSDSSPDAIVAAILLRL